MTTPVSWLRGLTPEPRYVGIGRSPGRLYPLLAYLTGLRGVAEAAVLRLPADRLERGSPPTAVTESLERALDGLAPPHEALLLYTGYYKATSFVGPVIRTAGGAPVFWKAFPDRAAAQAELERAALLRCILPGGTRTASCHLVTDRLVEYDVLPRSRVPATTRALVGCARGIAHRARSHARAVDVPVVGRHPAGRSTVHELAGSMTSAEQRRLDAALDGLGGTTFGISHGDFTRWNVFRMPDGSLGVVDYDAVAARPVLFDVVHLLTQSAVEKGRAPSLRVLRRATAGLLLGDDTAAAVADALLWDACETAQQYEENPDNRHRTRRTAGLKLAAWRACHA